MTTKKMLSASLLSASLARSALAGALALALSGEARAQLELPAASPPAKVEQRVGLTDVSVEYSSPAVKGRKVWGELVPFGKPWRTGANASTKITFSDDVTFGGKKVPAGTYSVVTIPTEKGWTVALNRELKLFSGGAQYDQKQDVVRVPATTAAVPHRERMTFLFSNTTDDATSLDLEWEKLKVSVPITVDTAADAAANIQKAAATSARSLASAARYVAENTKDYDRALKLADAAVAADSTWFNQWIRADILAKKGDYKEARKAAQIAWDLGQKDKGFFFRDTVQKALAEWKDK